MWIAFRGISNTNENFLYGALEGVLPVLGGIFGLVNQKRWGSLKSSMGKSVFFLSIGSIFWGLGTLVFAYYNIVLKVNVPYPSLADAFYIISWPLWFVAMVYLSRATGAKFELRRSLGKYILFLIPIIIIAVSYYLLIVVARQGIVVNAGDSPVTTFFDLAYPIGDLVILTTTLLIYGLSFRYLGGFFKSSIIIVLVGFVLNYFGDFAFVYYTTKGTYFVGDWIDLIYTTAFFFLAFGACLIDPLLYSKNIDARSLK